MIYTCAGCAHADRGLKDKNVPWTFWKCKSPKNRKRTTVNPVTGLEDEGIRELVFCETNRAGKMGCGEEGKWWEPA